MQNKAATRPAFTAALRVRGAVGLRARSARLVLAAIRINVVRSR